MLGRVLGSACQVAGAVIGTSAGVVSGVVGLATSALSPHMTWSAGDRVHHKVRGVQRDEAEPAVDRFERLLSEREGVRRAEVNAALGQVMVERDPARIGQRELTALVEAAERECGLDGLPTAPAATTHPAAAGPVLRAAVGVGVNVAGLGYATLARALPIPSWLPAPSLVSLVDAVPWLRELVEAAIGRPLADTVLTVAAATTNTASRRPLGLLADLAQQFGSYQEATARRRAWARWESDLAEFDGAHRAGPVHDAPRPMPVPDGPIERVGNLSAVLALGGYAAVLAASRSGQLASAALVAGVPKAARAGREGFAAQVDRDAGARGSLVLEAGALRRLDRVDTVVLDTSVLLTGRWVIDEVLVVDDGGEPVKLAKKAHDLVELERPRRRRERAGWTVAPLDKAATESLPGPVREAAADRADHGMTVLVLRCRERIAALVVVAEDLDPFAEALVAAARRAGTVLISDSRGRLDRRLMIDGVVPGEPSLLDSVRALQRDGHVVALIGVSGDAALAADVGIGLVRRGQVPPWGADVLCRGVDEACLLLDAVAPARETSRRSARLSVAASGLGGLLAALGPAAGAPLRASIPVHLAALLALGIGTWAGMSAGRRHHPAPVERSTWHAMSKRAVLTALDTSRSGLTIEESRRRRKAQPVEPDREEVGLGQASMEELANPLTPALATGAGLSASTGSVLDPVLIGLTLGLNALIGGVQRLGAQRSLRELTQTSAAPIRVRRNGREAEVTARDLVAGDVIELHAGDAVPADCRLLSGDGLEVDESSLTGESATVVKTASATIAPALADRHCMLYEGTVVAAGQAAAVVVATGERTEVGRALRADGDAAPATGVELRLRTLTARILPFSVAAGVALIAVDLLRRRTLAQALNQAVSLAVVAVPEGLPFVATVAELAAARRLSARGALVRNPSTIEALGRVNVLCFDKTGTLTEGRISLRGVSDGTEIRPVDQLSSALEPVLSAAVRASPFHLDEHQVTHQTDRAVLEGARRAGISAAHELDRLKHLGELPFASTRGYHATRWRGPGDEWISVKGAPEVVLPQCSRWRRAEDVVTMDEAARAQLDQEVDRLARQGYRVLAVAERSANGRAGLSEPDVEGLDFCGLVTLADPVRATAAEAVGTLRAAGVEIVIITGDHPSTAESIAAELDALNGRQVLTGTDLDALTDEQLAAALPRTAVFARVAPAQKARIVRQLQQAGKAVAVTGDGTNDALAIRLADVGLALGARATPAAREAADVVITDDRIETIADAIVEGRAMWSSVGDALSILLGGNLSEIAYTLCTAALPGGGGLNARQLLLINLLTDVLPAMAVAVRPPADLSPRQLLAAGPEVSLGAALNRDIGVRAVITSVAALGAWFLARPVSTAGQASTTGLVALVGAQLGQTVAVRGRTPLVIAAVTASLLILMIAVQVPGISHLVGSRPLLPHQWTLALVAATAATAAQLAAQHLLRPARPAQ